MQTSSINNAKNIRIENLKFSGYCFTILQTHHVYFHVVTTWNARGVFVGYKPNIY